MSAPTQHQLLAATRAFRAAPQGPKADAARDRLWTLLRAASHAKGWRELGEALVTEATRQGCARTLRAAEGLRLMDFDAPAECRLEALRVAADAVGRMVGELSSWRAPLAPENALVTAQDFECLAPLLAALAREFRRAASDESTP